MISFYLINTVIWATLHVLSCSSSLHFEISYPSAFIPEAHLRGRINKIRAPGRDWCLFGKLQADTFCDAKRSNVSSMHIACTD